MTLNFNSRYAIKCNFSQSWIQNFQNFLMEHAPRPPRRPKENFPRYTWNIFFWGGQISHSFLTLKLDRSAVFMSN